jgi:type III secretion system HrpE/YscL family protein
MNQKILKAPSLPMAPAGPAPAPPVFPETLPAPVAETRPLPPPAKIVDRRVFAAHDEVREILARAEEQATEIRAAAGREAEALRQEAREDGFRQGLGEWLERLAALGSAREELFAAARPEIVRLAVRVAEKILRRSLEADPSGLVPLIEEALAAAGAARGAGVLRLAASEAAALSAELSRRIAADPRWRGLEIAADPALPPGSCRVETACGHIDAGVETQLAAILAVLTRGAGA